MANFFGVIRRILNAIIKSDLDQIALQIAKTPTFKRLVISLNTEGLPTSQLYELGVDDTGKRLSSIGGDYSPFTIEKAKEDGRPKKSSSDINLKDTGAFYRSFTVIPYKGGFNIEADTTIHGDDLQDSWGKNLVGLTEQNLEIIVNFYRDALLQKVREKIQAA